MSGSLPRPSRSTRPSLNPPSAALPALPNPKTRKTNGIQPVARNPDASRTTTTLLPARASSATSPQSSRSSPSSPAATNNKVDPLTSNDPTISDTATPKAANKTVRRTVSIAAFPQPSKTASRLASLPSSPLSRTTLPTTSTTARRKTGVRRGSTEKVTLATPEGSGRMKRPKTAAAGNSSLRSFNGSRTPSLLNGTGDAKSISSGAGARGSDGLLSLPSPPHSRSSSAQGSCSTSATTFDDSGDGSPKDTTVAAGEDDMRPKTKEAKGNVLVSLRVRPDAAGENPRPEGEWMVDGRRSLVAYRGREGGDYYYDNVFTAHDKNAKVYDASAKRLVRRVMEGYHGTVFAYGMTGTGKTFSMQGTTTSPGVIPLAITDIFSYIRETPHREFLLRVSYLEIYNEKIHDLLSISVGADTFGANQQEEIKLREDPKRGVYASPLKEEIVQSPTQLLRVIARGDHARRTSSTQYNARSSRSHAVVQIVVESRERMTASGQTNDSKRSAIMPGGVRVSTLSLIDLAGSERAAENKERRQEGAHINKSLLTLGTVIARLSGDSDKNGNSTDRDGKHLPYRDSKLTRLLQGALSGNSLVSILCTIQIGSAGSVATANAHTGETLNTLKFAARAKNNIVSHAKRAEEAMGGGAGDAGSRVLLERYRMEIQELRNELDGQAKGKIEEEEKLFEQEQEQRHEEQMLEMQLARTALKERIEHLNRLILSSKSIGVNSSGSLSALGIQTQMSPTAKDQASSTRSSVTRSAVGAERNSLARTASLGSASTAHQQVNNEAGDSSPRTDNGREDEDSIGENGDGTATLSAQVRALQADLTDRNRYISTLEKRLLQARRSSHSRTSLTFSPTHKMSGMFSEDEPLNAVVKEKDAEIADLRARLDDKDRMVTALRSAARKRDVADLPSERSPSSPRKRSNSHVSPISNGKASSNVSPTGSGGKSRTNEFSPATNGHSHSDFSPVTNGNDGSASRAGGDGRSLKQSKNQDEMSRLLDEMIQDHASSAADADASRRGGPIGDLSVVSQEGRIRESTAAFPLELELLKFPLPATTSPLGSPVPAS
ncbi:MAG: hypothetical protein M1837_001386 [Sclerophora amabilis]|nr:MAG: hypothetical protein M1837_001386 [Sclerophora amabilis]